MGVTGAAAIACCCGRRATDAAVRTAREIGFMCLSRLRDAFVDSCLSSDGRELRARDVVLALAVILVVGLEGMGAKASAGCVWLSRSAAASAKRLFCIMICSMIDY